LKEAGFLSGSHVVCAALLELLSMVVGDAQLAAAPAPTA